MRPGRRQAGFTYLSALFAVAAVGLSLATTGELWSHARQREKEAELVWVGNQFRRAISLYYQRSPGTVKRYPEKLEELLEDKRFLTTQRYLRKIYDDPITGKPQWGLVPAPAGGIMGVYSLAETRFTRIMETSNSDRGWRFTYEPPGPRSPATHANPTSR